MKVKIVAVTKPLISASSNSDLMTPDEFLSYTARVSNPSNQSNMLTAPKLLNHLAKNKHVSPFEMAHAVMEIETTRDIARQILRHRSFSFQEFCVAEGTGIHVYHGGRKELINIEFLYKRFCNPGQWAQAINEVKVWDATDEVFVIRKIKEVFKTGIKPVVCLTLVNKRYLVATEDHKVLTKTGFKRIADLEQTDMIGTRPSYPSITARFMAIESIKPVGEAETYDLEIDHESHNYVVAEGIVTHNSQRYADPTGHLGFVVREARLQDTKNRQNSIPLEDDQSHLQSEWVAKQNDLIKAVEETYRWATDNNIAKEQARAVLPEGLTMSRLYMSGTIRSFIHYCALRMANGTQLEHQEIAVACWNELLTQFPTLSGIVFD